jgi:hypothetical protein
MSLPTDVSQPGPSVPELPHADDILELIGKDLVEVRSLLQRLLTTEDALTGAALTVSAAMLGLALSSKEAAIAWMTPLILALLGYFAGSVTVHRQRAAARVRALEHLVHAFVIVLRETGVARPRAVVNLRRAIDGYTYGVEGTFEGITLTDLWRVNRRQPRWWLYSLLALVAVASALQLSLSSSSSQTRVCVQTGQPAVDAQLDRLPKLTQGSIVVVACPAGATATTTPRTSLPTGAPASPSNGSISPGASSTTVLQPIVVPPSSSTP